MKKYIILILCVASVLLVTSCGNTYTPASNTNANEIINYKISDELPSIHISVDSYQKFDKELGLNNIKCPYSELFNIDASIQEKNAHSFEVEEHSYDFLNGADRVDAENLYLVVKENNKKYMDGIGKHFNKELSNSKLKECCHFVANTMNWGIENIEGLNLDELSCLLGNLKILNRGTMNLGTFNDKTGLLNISPDMIESKKDRTGNSNMYELTVCHEAMHILQCRCSDVQYGDDDHFIGTSYSFGNLSINPLKNRWLYEAVAELCAAQMLNTSTTTYQYMIDNLESISLATILNDAVAVGQIEKATFIKNENILYDQLGFADSKKAIEFLYAIELLREKPEDFQTVFTNTYGDFQTEYDEFLKLTYNPYFVEVISKLLYKNLAFKLTQHNISLNDVFYIMTLYEMDLFKDIPFDNAEVRGKYQSTYDNYVALKGRFLDMLQLYTNADIDTAFAEYDAVYGNTEKYANASLSWLDNSKRDYILKRNNVLYK